MLKGHRKFLPPQQPQEQPQEDPAAEDTPAVEQPNDGSDDAPIAVEEDSPEARELFATPSAVDTNKRSRSRGNGPGQWSTKQQAMNNEHKAKKLKAIEELTAIQKERHQLQKQFVDNQATFQAFMMAKAGLEANRHSPHWSAFHRKKMNDLIGKEDGVNHPGVDSGEEEEEDIEVMDGDGDGDIAMDSH